VKHSHQLRIGPVGFRLGSAWPGPIAAIKALYQGYPTPIDGIADFTVRLLPARPWRRWLRPQVAIAGDYTLADALPVSLQHGLLAMEMAMNLQMALGQRRYLLLHAAALARDDRALILTGESGAGKSTLSALAGEGNWRFLGDEFALVDPVSGLLQPFPRAVSLKNAAIDLFADQPGRLGPVQASTPKGTIRHLRPKQQAIAQMDMPARPAAILFPRYGFAADVRPVGKEEAFVRLTQASTNYAWLGEAGFMALSQLVRELPTVAIDYPDSATGLDLLDQIWAEL
jgi:HprK-related kinase A